MAQTVPRPFKGASINVAADGWVAVVAAFLAEDAILMATPE